MISRLEASQDRGLATRGIGAHPFAPLLKLLLVSVGSSLDGYLRGPVQLLQQPRHMRLVGADAENLPHHRGHADAGPYLASESVRCCSVRQQVRNQLQLFLAQLQRTTRPWLGTPRLVALGAHFGDPAADSRFRHTQSLGSLALFPSECFQFQSAFPPCFFPVAWLLFFPAHTPDYGTSPKLNLEMQRSVSLRISSRPTLDIALKSPSGY